MIWDEDGAIRLSVMRALWGEVFPQTRVVFCRRDAVRAFTIEFYVDSVSSDELVESASCVETEVIAYFSDDFAISHRVIRVDAPGVIPTDNRLLVFMRREQGTGLGV
jgi:hypothetical protein